MRLEVIRKFYDTEDKVTREVGDNFEVSTKKRGDLMVARNFCIEIKEDKKERKTKNGKNN